MHGVVLQVVADVLELDDHCHEFMRTDSFETPLVDFDETDSEDATLMPEQVPEAPEIEDVFDITGEGVLPPVKSDDAEGDDSPNDDAEGLTVYGSRS